MSTRLRELIRSVRQCKTAAEERNVIAKESAALRNAFKEQDSLYRHRNVAKLMYIHMLGYPTHFGQMETLKLIAAAGFPEKRIGYLGLMILLDERQEVLMLVTNSLKNDLNARNQYIVGLALCALGNICSAEMARDLAPELEKLLGSSNSFIRKKTALCCTRVLRKVPDAIESFQDKAASLLSDRHHGVLLGGVTLMLEICDIDPAAIEAYRAQVPNLCKVLRSLLVGGFAPEHDVGGTTDPFLQVKILRLLRVLGSGSADASDAMSDILAQVAANTEGARNPGNAILYECVQTVMGVESSGGLRLLAINILGRFLANHDNNIRYVALNILARVVGVDTAAVQRHRATIVACVKDADVSIRRRALELVYALVNEGNIKALTKELIDYLQVADPEFKPDLVAKIAQLVTRFAPDKRWHFDSLLQVLTQAGEYVKDDMCRGLVVLLTNTPHLHAYAARSLYKALRPSPTHAPLALALTAAWFLGEFGELVSNSELLEGEQAIEGGATPADVVTLLGELLTQGVAVVERKDYALTALLKLSVRFPDQATRIQGMLAAHASSGLLEVQARAVEYGALFRFPDLRGRLVERMPPLDEVAYRKQQAALHAGAHPQARSNGVAAAAVADLLTLDDEEPAPIASQSSAADALHDLLGGDLLGPQSSVAAVPPAHSDILAMLDVVPTTSAPASQPRGVLDDLLGGGGATAAPPAAALVSPALGSAALPDIFSLGGEQPSPSAAAPAPPVSRAAVTTALPAQYQTITAFEKNGISVTFAFSKPPNSPNQTDIQASAVNTGAAEVTSFTMQAAVPKFMTLKLDPASGSTLEAGAGNTVRQQLHITNSQHGEKKLALRLRIAYTLGGEAKLEQLEVKNLPPGL